MKGTLICLFICRSVANWDVNEQIKKAPPLPLLLSTFPEVI